MERGAFITVEGGEGVGKSTSLATIEAGIRALGYNVVVTREPGGTVIGEQVRNWILDGHHDDMQPVVEALLMFAARAQHLAELIEPALAAGKWVLCDRFTDATMAYQGGGRGVDRKFLACLAMHVQQRLVPDLTLLLDAPVEVGFQRIAGRPHDHFERAGHSFLERVRAAYLAIARSEPERVKVVDATAAPGAVAEVMLSHLRAFASSRAQRSSTPS